MKFFINNFKFILQIQLEHYSKLNLVDIIYTEFTNVQVCTAPRLRLAAYC